MLHFQHHSRRVSLIRSAIRARDRRIRLPGAIVVPPLLYPRSYCRPNQQPAGRQDEDEDYSFVLGTVSLEARCEDVLVRRALADG